MWRRFNYQKTHSKNIKEGSFDNKRLRLAAIPMQNNKSTISQMLPFWHFDMAGRRVYSPIWIWFINPKSQPATLAGQPVEQFVLLESNSHKKINDLNLQPNTFFYFCLLFCFLRQMCCEHYFWAASDRRRKKENVIKFTPHHILNRRFRAKVVNDEAHIHPSARNCHLDSASKRLRRFE